MLLTPSLPAHFQKELGHSCHISILVFTLLHNRVPATVGYIQKSPSQIINISQAGQLFITYQCPSPCSRLFHLPAKSCSPHPLSPAFLNSSLHSFWEDNFSNGRSSLPGTSWSCLVKLSLFCCRCSMNVY